MLSGMAANERKRPGRPRTGETPRRTIRIPNQRWNAALRHSAAEGITVAQVVNDLLEEWVQVREAELSLVDNP